LELALFSSTFFMPDANRKSTRVLRETREIAEILSPRIAANGKSKKPSATGKVRREDVSRAQRNAKVERRLDLQNRVQQTNVAIAGS
jgi:hypothetical protein